MSARSVSSGAGGSGAERQVGPEAMDIDCAAACARIETAIREMTSKDLHRRGVVVAVSGGVDSAVCLALAARALGPERVLALLMPERESDPDGTARGRVLCEGIGVEYIVEDIAPILDALGCYRRRNEAIRELFPEFGPEWRCKIAVAENLLDSDRVNFFTLTVESPDGKQDKRRLPFDVYLAVVAATNMKQRTRKLLEYHHAERLNYAVVGTPNRLEYDQGFFVRGGDGLADMKPIAHLYKTQVYAIARFMGVPDEICRQPPSTDTYSLPQTQEEFFFALPYDRMDLLLYAYDRDIDADQAAVALDLSREQVQRAFRDIAAKRRTAKGLHQSALLVPGESFPAGSPPPGGAGPGSGAGGTLS